MKLQILPNWCKKIGLVIFIISFIIGSGDDFREGFNSGYNSTRNSETTKTLENEKNVNEQLNDLNQPTFLFKTFGETGLHIFEILSIFGMLIYMLSKEKIEDDYIHKLRFESYKLSSIIWLLAAILIYAFNENFKLSIDYFIFLFIWTYLITFFIKKRIY